MAVLINKYEWDGQNPVKLQYFGKPCTKTEFSINGIGPFCLAKDTDGNITFQLESPNNVLLWIEFPNSWASEYSSWVGPYQNQSNQLVFGDSGEFNFRYGDDEYSNIKFNVKYHHGDCGHLFVCIDPINYWEEIEALISARNNSYCLNISQEGCEEHVVNCSSDARLSCEETPTLPPTTIAPQLVHLYEPCYSSYVYMTCEDTYQYTECDMVTTTLPPTTTVPSTVEFSNCNNDLSVIYVNESEFISKCDTESNIPTVVLYNDDCWSLSDWPLSATATASDVEAVHDCNDPRCPETYCGPPTVAPTLVPTTTLAPTTTLVPTTTLAPTTTPVPTTTLAPTTTVAPTTTLAPPSLAACGSCVTSPCPTIEMRLTWDDADVTKSWLGCTWTNNETKEVYATEYSLNTVDPIYNRWERWERNITVDNRLSMRRSYHNSYAFGTRDAATLWVDGPENTQNDLFRVNTSPFFNYSNVDIGILNVGDVGQGPGDFRILNKQKNNTFTDVSNITYTWTEGNGW